jgi:predicted DNA-binding protein (UPF0251 family)
MPRGGRRQRNRGRCRGRRWVNYPYETDSTATERKTQPQKPTIQLRTYEIEALRLVDLEDLTQEEAAAMMGVSRKTLWNDLHKARKKITNALVNDYQIRIEHGKYIKIRKGGEE